MNDSKVLLRTPQLTTGNQLKQLVENETKFCLNNCELSLFETHIQSYNHHLYFNNIGFTSMLQGRKHMKIKDKTDYFDYYPGESLLVAPGETMVIDFPEADHHPTQCLSIGLNQDFIASTLEELNHHFSKVDENSSWNIQYENFYLFNTSSLASATNNIMRIAMDDNAHKDLMADFALKELLIRLMQTQARTMVEKNSNLYKTRINMVVDYIRQNLHQKLSIDSIARHVSVSKTNFFKMFKEELGTSPNDFILKERIKKAKALLAFNNSIKETAYQTGFSDTNYFTKVFKQVVGMTPKVFQKQTFEMR